jgi:tetratricopeptide (TPR) repeat protein
MTAQDFFDHVTRLEAAGFPHIEGLRSAVEYARTDPGASLAKSRTVLEKVVLDLFRAEMGKDPRKPLLADMLGDNQFTRKIERRVLALMNNVRELGNLGTHGETVVARDAERVLADLLDVLDWHLERGGTAAGVPAEGVVTGRPVAGVPRPPELYAVPPYTLTTEFVGRRAELAELDAWTGSADPVMVVEAIGGMGKSALTWEWVQKRAEAVIPGLAGRLWWSFYERGTSMKTFLRHALAYATRQDPEALRDLGTHECGQRLLAELKRRPFLLVLDGFERVLTAYHRPDKAQLRDDRIPVDARECTNPRDGDVLKWLVQCAPSKVLVSTRLMPKALEDRHTRRPIPGVRHLGLEGLAPDDVLALVWNAGVRGNTNAILRFAEQCGGHALVLRIVCGMVVNYPPAPADFAAWRADPLEGGGLRLGEMELKQRYTHVLEFAFRGLGEKSRQLLSRIAVLSDSADYDTVAVLNPFLPPRPEEVPEPKDPFQGYRWQGYQKRLSGTGSPAMRSVIEAEWDAYRVKLEAEFRLHREAYERSQAQLRWYLGSAEYRKGVATFRAALRDLEDRGLLQWDRLANAYDLHPVIRAYAFERLEERDRTPTYNAIRDHFAGLPPENVEAATDLAHVKNSVEIMRALMGAGRFAEAMKFYREELSNCLLYSLGAYHTVVELLTPVSHCLRQGTFRLADASDGRFSINSLAIALGSLGRFEEAIPLYHHLIRSDVAAGRWEDLSGALLSLAVWAFNRNQLASSARIGNLAGDVAAAAGAEDMLTRLVLGRMIEASLRGRFDEAGSLLASFRARLPALRPKHKPGEAEYWIARMWFCQGRLTVEELLQAEQAAAEGRILSHQHQSAALRAEWELTRGNPAKALDAIEGALSILRKTGQPSQEYVGIRALALARLGHTTEARDALAESDPLNAAEAWLALGDREKARECVLEAYPRAWADGPPYARWHDLKRCRELLAALGEPEPRLPPFDPASVEPVPFEAEVRAAIDKLKAGRVKTESDREG